MSADFDALVEKAARAVYDDDRESGSYDRWGIAHPSEMNAYRRIARTALDAIGLPALLERVKAAEGALAEMRSQRP